VRIQTASWTETTKTTIDSQMALPHEAKWPT
jgi:hypothetical protein